MRHLLLLVIAFSSSVVMAADIQALIGAYYNCGMSKYSPGDGVFIRPEDEVLGSTNLLAKHCMNDYEALKQSLIAFEKATTIKVPPSYAATTLQGHLEHARNNIRFLMRLDRLAFCWEFKAGEYVRGTKESTESILDASLLGCPEDYNRLKEIIKMLSMADAQMDRALQIARQRVTKYILDERLKQKGK